MVATARGSLPARLNSLVSWALILACFGFEACAGTSDGGARIGVPVRPVDDLDLKALLLLLEDRRIYDDYAVGSALQGDRLVRRRLAYALGRLDDPRAGLILEELLLDEEVGVRRAAAFALGRRGRPEAVDALLAACRSPDVETGRLAVEALAVVGANLDVVLASLDELPTSEVWPRLAPSLYRFPARRTVALAEHALELEDRRLAVWAAYSLARDPVPRSAALLRGLLEDEDHRVRAWAARGLGLVGDGTDMERLLPLLQDDAAGPRIQALRAGGELVASGRAAPVDAWRRAILDSLADRRPGVSVSAVETAAYWLLDEDLGPALVELAASASSWERESALLALAEGEHPRAPELMRAAAVSSEPVDRAAAAGAAAKLDGTEWLVEAFADPVPAVRLAALAGLLSSRSGTSREFAAMALADPDPGVRAATLDWLVANPELPAEAIEGALAPVDLSRVVDLPINGVRALAARAEKEPLERGLILARLERMAGLGDYPVRRLAASRIEALGEPRPAIGPAVRGKGLDLYRDVARRTTGPRFVEIKTTRGTVRLRLACPEAPLTCLSFLQLTNQGFYDGLTFHRVIPDFVVQAGDPRGDGWGGPGYSIRDEAGPMRFGDGVLGMALSGPDTAGSQFFITLSPQPHLDGVFTAFGVVVGGREVLDRITQGDQIVRIREVG